MRPHGVVVAPPALDDDLRLPQRGEDLAVEELDGDTSAVVDYGRSLERVRKAYSINLASFYGLERRWAERPFGNAAMTVYSLRQPWRSAPPLKYAGLSSLREIAMRAASQP